MKPIYKNNYIRAQRIKGLFPLTPDPEDIEWIRKAILELQESTNENMRHMQSGDFQAEQRRAKHMQRREETHTSCSGESSATN